MRPGANAGERGIASRLTNVGGILTRQPGNRSSQSGDRGQVWPVVQRVPHGRQRPAGTVFRAL